MGLVLRQNIGRRLNIAEMDGNFTYLQSIAGGSGSFGNTFSVDTYSNWYTKSVNGLLNPGTFIEISDRADTGIVLYCAATNSFALEGTGGFLNGDYQAVGNYSDVDGFISADGQWTYEDEYFNITYTFGNYANITLASVTGFNVGDSAHTNNSSGYISNISGLTITYLISGGDPTDNVWVTDDTTTTTSDVVGTFSIVNSGTYITGEAFTGNRGDVMVFVGYSGDDLTFYRSSGTNNSDYYFGNSSGLYLYMNGLDIASTAQNGVAFVYDGYNYIVTDDTQLNGNPPNSNTEAYVEHLFGVEQLGEKLDDGFESTAWVPPCQGM